MSVLRFVETLESTMKEWMTTLGMKFIKGFMQPLKSKESERGK
jgi:hypothetical protein